ncbi:hypothetical protein BD410DRAFT_727096 [Rickenella mellea]|uniref:Cytochrome b-c1 complex subunit 8 n=1 Tax=Rickenella mellea TaxID=50990 RepID=A0A4Y7PWN2_9AGAM|nr:hypothetical protein BD410DRAFT_727096 [Rickenella mellea]
MGWWGAMGGGKQKGIIQYTTSPFRQRAMKGALTGYVFNGYKRVAGHLPYYIIPFSLGNTYRISVAAYATYVWGKNYDHWKNSKAGHVAMMEKEGEH